jgi:8-oxo-dGTP pyrophosphatase MutT (NUDIX family)
VTAKLGAGLRVLHLFRFIYALFPSAVMKKHGPYTIKSSKTLHRDEFIELRVDEVIRPNGEPGRYATARMVPGVAVLPLDKEGFVYLVKQFRYAVGKDCVEAVAGAIDGGEGPEEAARRELHEELGIEAAEMSALGMVDAITSQADSPSHLFLARGLSFKERDPDDTERLEPVKVKFDEAVRMAMGGEITQATSAVLIFKADYFLRREPEG